MVTFEGLTSTVWVEGTAVIPAWPSPQVLRVPLSVASNLVPLICGSRAYVRVLFPLALRYITSCSIQLHGLVLLPGFGYR